MNKVCISGRLTKDIDLRCTPNGTKVVSFSIAVDTFFGTETTTSFIDCVAWNKSADFLDKYCKKGNMLLIEGRLQKRDYERKDGTKVYLTEIMVDRVENVTPRDNSSKQDESTQEQALQYETPTTYDDDDLPF